MKSLFPRNSFGRNPVLEGWIFRGGFAYPTSTRQTDSMKRRLFNRLLRKGVFSKLHLQDELLQKYASFVPGSKTEVALAADPIQLHTEPSSRSAREQLGIPEFDRPIVSCVGMVNRRKGVHLAIKAFLHFKEGQQSLDANLILAGPHNEEIRSMLMAPGIRQHVETGSIISMDRFLTSQEMLLVAEASELVLAPYPNHSGRSGIILWAAAGGTQVLAVDRGCIKHVVETEQLGSTCDVTDIDLFASAIRESLTRDWTSEDEKRCRNYAAWHRAENYQTMSSAFVRQRLQQAGKIGT
jgi:glycosyltransferase involved in cell wall biosynthesis